MSEQDPDRARFSADLPHPGFAGALGHSEIVRVLDVLIATTDSRVDSSDHLDKDLILMADYPEGPFGARREPQPIDLGASVQIVRLDHEQAQRVMNACAPRGHFFHPVRQFGQQYSFVRQVGVDDWRTHLYHWDSDNALEEAVSMARLILDHGYSTEFAARVIQHEDGEQIIVPVYNPQPAFRLRHTRNWMTRDETAGLRELFAAFRARKSQLPERVNRALWNLNYGATMRWLDIRVPLLVIAFEGLVSTSTELVRRQFAERVPQLAQDVGHEGLTPKVCKDLYDARSRWAHGSHIALKREARTEPDSDPAEAATSGGPQNVILLEDALRKVIRRCIEDPGFASKFQDAEAVRAAWPVVV